MYSIYIDSLIILSVLTTTCYVLLLIRDVCPSIVKLNSYYCNSHIAHSNGISCLRVHRSMDVLSETENFHSSGNHILTLIIGIEENNESSNFEDTTYTHTRKTEFKYLHIFLSITSVNTFEYDERDFCFSYLHY